MSITKTNGKKTGTQKPESPKAEKPESPKAEKPKNSFENKIEELTGYIQQNYKMLQELDRKIAEMQQQRAQVAILIDSQQYTISTLTDMNKVQDENVAGTESN